MVNRRHFLKLFSLASAGLATGVLPSPMKVQEVAADQGVELSLDEINELVRVHIVPGIVDDFFKRDSLLQYLKQAR